jgi:hypothetical protein
MIMNLEEILFGVADKHEGIQQVLSSEPVGWKQLYEKEFSVFLDERGHIPFIADEFRAWFHARGNPRPHHGNVWGAMWNSTVKKGTIQKTGVFRAATMRSNHASLYPEWVAV